MPYSNVPREKWGSMERCTEAVRKQGKSEQIAIAICYSSIMGKKVLLSPYPVPDIPIGDLIPPEGGDPLSWQQVSERTDEWARKQLSRREAAARARCSVQDCPASPTQLVTVKGAVLPYCDEHLPGAKDVLARHNIKVEGVRSAEQVWVDAKGFFFRDSEGRVIFAGGPGGGSGGSSPGKTFGEAVASGKITSNSNLGGGVTDASIVDYEDDGSGVVKNLDAAGGSHDGNSEVAAYQINQLLGGNEVPETVYVERNGRKVGTSQMFIPDATLGSSVSIGEIHALDRQQVERVLLLDAIIGNSDRHEGNFLVKDGNLVAIDHGHAKWTSIRSGYNPLKFNQILAGLESNNMNDYITNLPFMTSGHYRFSEATINALRGIKQLQFYSALKNIDTTRNVKLTVAWDNLQYIIENGGL